MSDRQRDTIYFLELVGKTKGPLIVLLVCVIRPFHLYPLAQVAPDLYDTW